MHPSQFVLPLSNISTSPGRNGAPSRGHDPFTGLRRSIVQTFFERARTFVHSRPWDVLQDLVPIEVEVPALELAGACAFVWTAPPDVRGLIVVPSYAAYRSFFAGAARFDAAPSVFALADVNTPFWAVDFFAEEELCGALVERVARQGLVLADRDSYPVPQVVERGGIERAASPRDLEKLGAILVALTDVTLFHREAIANGEVVDELIENDTAPASTIRVPHTAHAHDRGAA